MPNCLLCAAEPLTERFYEDDLIWIAVCANPRCGQPIVVFKRHAPEPTYGEWYRAFSVCEERFPDLRPRVKRRSIPEHPHFHLSSDGRP